MLGAEFCKRYGVNPKVVNAIASHHHEVEQETVEAASLKPPMPFLVHVRAPAARTLKPISNVFAISKNFLYPSKVSNKPSQFKPDAKSV